MTDDEVLREAAFDGFELEERPVRTPGCGAGARVTTNAGSATGSDARRSTGCETGWPEVACSS